ncbi:DUF2971 domain-containing protein [Pseudomonas sp. SDO55104_S430]
MAWKEDFKQTMLGPYIEPDDINTGFLLKFRNIPKQLFKYREFDERDNSLKNLIESTVWMNSPQNFNDPYDCSLAVKLNKVNPSMSGVAALYDQLKISKETQEIEFSNFLKTDDPIASAIRFLVKKDILDETLAEELISAIENYNDVMVGEFSEKTKNLTKVCSFSETEKSTLMWAHYASYHTGFCIEYNFTTLGPESLITRFLYPVFYSDLLHDHSDFITEIDMNRANPLSIVLPALTKASDWAYEKEWRLVFSNNFMKEPQTCIVPKATRVYAGVKISAKNLSKLESVCAELEIPLTRMKMSNTSFSIIPDINLN